MKKTTRIYWAAVSDHEGRGGYVTPMYRCTLAEEPKFFGFPLTSWLSLWM